MDEKHNQGEWDEEALLTFLKRTRDGDFAEVERTSLTYSRLNIEREEAYSETDDFYYTIR